MELVLRITKNDMEIHGDEIIQKIKELYELKQEGCHDKFFQNIPMNEHKKEQPQTLTTSIPEKEQSQTAMPQTSQYQAEEIRSEIAKTAKTIGKTKVKALLQKYGADNFPQLQQEYYNAFMKELKELE